MTSKIVVNNIEADSGISTVTFASEVTAPTFNGNITGTAATFTTGTFSGNVDIAGALTYEDVTNVDSVGIVTARSGIHVTGGNVGIGTDNPNRLLTVKRTDSAGAYAEMGASQDGGIRGLQFRSADNGVYKGAIHTLDATSSGGMIALATGGAERFRITSDGNVGVGTQSPNLAAFTGPTFTVGKSANPYSVTELQGSSTSDSVISLIHAYNIAGSSRIGQIAFRRDGADNSGAISFTTWSSGSSSEKLRITSAGNLGIGLTNPGALLSIPAGESNTPRLAIESAVDDNDFTITQYEDGNGTYTVLGQNVKLNSGGNNTVLDSAHRTAGILLDARNHGAITFLTGGANAVGENVKIDSSGNLIVDAGGEAQDIQIKSHSANSGHGVVYLRGNASNESSSIQLNHYGHADYHVSAGRVGNGLFSITRTSGGSDGIIMDSSGNMGLGVTPAYSGVFGGSQRVFHIGGTTAPGLRIQSSTSNQGDFIIQAGNSGGATYISNQSSNADTVFFTSPSGTAKESLRISSGGELSISGAKSGNNISDAILKFNIVNSNGDSKKAEIKAIKTADTSSELIFGTTASHAFAERMRISSTGRVGVNDSTSGWAEALQVTSLSSQGQYGVAIKIQNNSGYLMRFQNGTNICGSVSSSGGNNTNFNTSWSDSRRKKNFENWNEEVLPLFKTLEPKKFNFTHEDDGTEKTKGYVAQDVVNKFPEAYPLLDDTEVDDQRYMFNPSGMTVYLMKALQEEIAKREALEARIAALEGS